MFFPLIFPMPVPGPERERIIYRDPPKPTTAEESEALREDRARRRADALFLPRKIRLRPSHKQFLDDAGIQPGTHEFRDAIIETRAAGMFNEA